MRARVASLALAVALGAVLLVAWKAYVELFDVSRFVLPPPEDVGAATVDLLGQGATWRHTWVTVHEILTGFAIATVLGVATGAVIGEVPVLERALNPYLVALQVLPKVAVLPLLILWLGFGSSVKVVIAAVFAFFPIVAGTRAGVRSVEAGHRDLVTTLDAGIRQRMWLVELPSALPSILTGMEVGAVLATVGAVVAEYLAGSQGLGYLAVASLNQLQVDRLFGVIVLLCAVGMSIYAAVVGLRRVLVPWHPSGARQPPGW